MNINQERVPKLNCALKLTIQQNCYLFARAKHFQIHFLKIVAKVFSDKLSIDKTYHQSVYKIEGNTSVALL
jgi:hypothetical protein